jgi:hypothetical protein
MQRDLMRSPLLALLSGLLLVACGGALEAEQPPIEQSPGTQESAMCAGLSVTNLSITGISTVLGEMAGSGEWAVSTYANAVQLEYYVDGVLSSTDVRRGTSGTWYFSASVMACGSNTFQVKAYPMVIDSNNNQTLCNTGSRSAAKTVTESCPVITSNLSCWRDSAYVYCRGTASGGSGPYTLFWREYNSPASGNSYTTPWYEDWEYTGFYCPEPYYSYGYDTLEVSFYARDDGSGARSNVSYSGYFYCAAGSR